MKDKKPLNKNASPLKFDPITMGIISGVGGLAQIGGAIVGSKRRKEEERVARRQFDQYMSQLEQRDTSNPFTGMENVYEDLTVNTQAADFTAQQQSQGMANTLDQLKGAAGGSGIAALAQAMANQQALNAQTASVDIGKQERSNLMAEIGMASQIQQQEMQGELLSRRMEQQKGDLLLGMSQDRLASARLARQQATEAIMGGLGQIAGGAITGFMGNREDFLNLG